MSDEKIEAELPEPADTDPIAVERSADGESEGGISGGLIGGMLIFVVLAAGVGWLLLSTESADTFSYSRDLVEVMENPEEFADKILRVEGDLLVGSIQFQEEPCSHDFTIQRGGHSMDVTFPRCVVPDTFVDRPGVIITVQGRLNSDGSFDADQVVPKCPTRYNPDEHALGGGPEGEGLQYELDGSEESEAPADVQPEAAPDPEEAPEPEAEAPQAAEAGTEV